ncbi:MAG: hypothetical protein R3C05_17265 [Pirellulaceae bacterium]
MALDNTTPVADPISMLRDLLTGSAPSQATLDALLPFELLRGQPMDLNRPFGDGLDNDGMVL